MLSVPNRNFMVANLHGSIHIALVVCCRLGCGAGHWIDNDRDGSRKCGEAHLIAVSCTIDIGGIRPYIIYGATRQSCNITGETPRTIAIDGVIAVHCRVLEGAPAHSSGNNRYAAIGCYVAAAGGRYGGDVGNDIGGYGGHSGGRCYIEIQNKVLRYNLILVNRLAGVFRTIYIDITNVHHLIPKIKETGNNAFWIALPLQYS